MHKSALGGLVPGLLAVLVTASVALAQQQPVRVRGAIAQVDGTNMTVQTREGEPMTIKLADNVAVAAVERRALTDVKAGDYIGVTALPGGEGAWRAVAIHIFPEAMRGTAEGHRPWDLLPESTMTNATVADTVSRVQGTTLTLKYKDGDKAIQVGPDTPIVALVPGERSELKPGAKVVVNATQGADGAMQAARVTVSRGGVDPPM